MEEIEYRLLESQKYSEEELFSMWKKFRYRFNSAEILRGLAVCTTREAHKMIIDFQKRLREE